MYERHLAQAERHVIQGEALVAQQRELVGWLERLESGGYCATESRRLLRLFEEVLGLHIADRDRLLLKSNEGAAQSCRGGHASAAVTP